MAVKIDITNPGAPYIVGSRDTPGSARRVALAGCYAFVADTSWNLKVIDISDPASPILMGACTTPGNAYDVALADGYAYVADRFASGLQVIAALLPLESVSYVDEGTLTAVVPSGQRPGTWHLQVTNSDGGHGVLETAFTVTTTARYTILGYFHEVQYGPGGLAYDELTDSLWSSDIIAKKILKIDPNGGAVLTTLNVSYNSLPTGLTWKDGYLWNSDQWAVPEVIHKIDPVNGNSVDTIPGLGGLTFDNQGRLWSSNWDIQLRALHPSDGSILDTITLSVICNAIFGMSAFCRKNT